MNISLSDEKKLVDELNKAVNKIADYFDGSYSTSIGIIGSKNTRPAEGDIDNAGLGLVHEFGSIIRNIPPRSWLRMPIYSLHWSPWIPFSTPPASRQAWPISFRLVGSCSRSLPLFGSMETRLAGSVSRAPCSRHRRKTWIRPGGALRKPVERRVSFWPI